MLAGFAGSVLWVIGASWGWSDSGWMVRYLGYHDAYASAEQCPSARSASAE